MTAATLTPAYLAKIKDRLHGPDLCLMIAEIERLWKVEAAAREVNCGCAAFGCCGHAELSIALNAPAPEPCCKLPEASRHD